MLSQTGKPGKELVTTDRPVIARTGKRAPLAHEVSFITLTPVTKARDIH